VILTDATVLAAEGVAAVLKTAPAPSADDRYATVSGFKYALLLSLGMDEIEVRTAWESAREATTVHAADTSSVADLPHSAVDGDLTALREPSRITPSGVEEMTRLAPAEQVRSADDPAEKT
jgi:hypothetical protein